MMDIIAIPSEFPINNKIIKIINTLIIKADLYFCISIILWFILYNSIVCIKLTI